MIKIFKNYKKIYIILLNIYKYYLYILNNIYYVIKYDNLSDYGNL